MRDSIPARGDRKWAPWWAYLAPILGVNYLRQIVVPFGTVPVIIDVLLAVMLAGAVFVLITAFYRLTQR
ncbi:hypothetical protein [Nocardia sp. CY41]|uniref:hypothetical protein n=1 Tax=Nocardia sp. CY41 TaxID=2608686 RepID=UPI00191660FF|nr:hypothetical protein [Nocardia sp. CY41]